MATVVVPFRSGGKTRLPEDIRTEVALAMLGDVLEAAVEIGEVRLVTSDDAGRLVGLELGVAVVDDPETGQGPAVLAGLAGVTGVCLIVNADLPRAQAQDLAALSIPAQLGLAGIVEAGDGTTNALSLPAADLFEPLYGPDSAKRFRLHLTKLGLDLDDLNLPNLRDDVDSLADLEQIGNSAGARTRSLLQALEL